MLQPLFPLRETIRSLAPPLQMPEQTVPNVAFDLTVGTGWVPEGEVVYPTSEMPIQFPNQDRDRLVALMTTRHFVQLFPFPPERLLRRKHVQVLPMTSFQIVVVPKRKPQKIQTRALFPQVHHPRLFPIDLQLEFTFQPRFDELDGFRSHLFGQRDEIIGVAHQLDIGPSRRPLRTVKQSVEPMQVQVREQRRGDSPNAKDNFEFERRVRFLRKSGAR
jgi:hypothetical protein